MSGRVGRRGVTRIGFLGLVLCAVLPAVGFRSAGANTGFVIGHPSPIVAAAGQDLDLSAVVTSTCSISTCGDIRLVVVYRTPAGTRFEAETLPAVKAQVGQLRIPGVYVRVPSVAYRLAAYQERCFFMSCSTASAETPWYTVMVRRM